MARLSRLLHWPFLLSVSAKARPLESLARRGAMAAALSVQRARAVLPCVRRAASPVPRLVESSAPGDGPTACSGGRSSPRSLRSLLRACAAALPAALRWAGPGLSVLRCTAKLGCFLFYLKKHFRSPAGAFRLQREPCGPCPVCAAGRWQRRDAALGLGVKSVRRGGTEGLERVFRVREELVCKEVLENSRG